MRISAYFYGTPDDNMDRAARSIFETRGGRSIGAGTWMVGPSQGERDVEYEVPDDKSEETKTALKKAGFRLTPTRTE